MTVTSDTQRPAPVKKKRGSETVLDMFRTLGVIGIAVAVLFFFGQASKSDKASIRPVDPSEILTLFKQDTGGPIPTTPKGWIVNVEDGGDGIARVGYVLGGHYTEFQGATGTTFLVDATGKGAITGTVNVNGVIWQEYTDGDGHTSLVHSYGKATVLIGGIRENATLSQLETLAATVH